MANVFKPSIRTGGKLSNQQVVDPTIRINKILEANYNIFELRHRKASPYNKVIFGFDDVQIDLLRNPNNHEIKYRVRVIKSAQLSFEPDQENVLYAFLPDTEKNRRLLAKQIYSCEWDIVQLITPTGNIPAKQIQEEINRIAKIFKVQKPIPIAKMDMRLKGQKDRAQKFYDALNEKEKMEMQSLLSGKVSQETEKVNPEPIGQQSARMQGQIAPPINTRAPMAIPPPGPQNRESPENNIPPADLTTQIESSQPMTKDQATEFVYNKNSSLLKWLQKESPKGWKATKQYREIIVPEINAVMEAQAKPQASEIPAGNADVPANLQTQLEKV